MILSGPSIINALRALSRIVMKTREEQVIFHAFLYYLILRSRRMLKEKFQWHILPHENLKKIIDKLSDHQDDYVDRETSLLISVGESASSKVSWAYVCSRRSSKKYKLQLIPFRSQDRNIILLSDTMHHNIKTMLQCGPLEHDTFLIPLRNRVAVFATESKVSLISNPHDSMNQIMDILLENYFSSPRFLRKNDIFEIDTKEYLPAQLYLSSNPLMPVLYFKVNSIKVNTVRKSNRSEGAYIVKGETSLMQESNIHSYLPRKCSFTVVEDSLENILSNTKEFFVEKCPQALSKALEDIETCIVPFISQGIQLRVKPIFLVKGAQGSGKRMLIKIAAEKLGLHLVNADLAEVQTLTSAQTEAKLRIVLHNAEQCAPCILCLNNIEVFGKNAEGQKDERVISTFANELNTLCDKRAKYPVIIIATSNESDIPAELNRLFVHTLQVDHLDQAKKAEIFSWLLKKQGLNHSVNLSKLAGMCSDFNFSDINTFILRAVKAHHKRTESREKSIILDQDDFDKAYEYIQSVYTDYKGAPRVPKVYWEDIGGLADLKHEIMRRIQLPLLNAFGFGQSGLLLYGPPGTGKTLLAKAVATEYQLHFLSVKGPEVLNMYVGQSEKNVRQVFERARATAPCIIFFDELDSLAPNRGRSGDSGGVMDRVVSQLLAEMDGLDGSSNIFIIGATNRPDLIDPALLRPGRFDKMLYVGIHSDPSSQLSVLKALTRKFKLQEGGKELEELVTYLPKYATGADLYGVCSDAWLNAAREVLNNFTKDDNTENLVLDRSIIVGLGDFLKAIRTMVPSVTEAEAKRYERMQLELSSTS